MSLSEFLINQDALIKEMHGRGTTDLHLAGFFRVQKSREEQISILEAHGLPPTNNPHLPIEIRDLLWEDKQVESGSTFTFPSRTLILGQTTEDVSIPLDEMWRMRSYFNRQSTGEQLRLRTNITAPILKPGSLGHQVYEIYNETDELLTLPISDLVCITDIIPLGAPITPRGNSQFRKQELGDIRLGKV